MQEPNPSDKKVYTQQVQLQRLAMDDPAGLNDKTYLHSHAEPMVKSTGRQRANLQWQRLEQASTGVELWSCLMFILWGVYFFFVQRSYPNAILNFLINRHPWGSVICEVIGVSTAIGLYQWPPTYQRWSIVVRKIGAGISFSVWAGLLVSLAQFAQHPVAGTINTGTLVTPIAMFPLVLMLFIAVVRWHYP